MSDQQQTLRDDIAFLRSLAQDGRQGGLIGGSILFAAGLIFGGCALASWWAVAFRLSLLEAPWFFPSIWFAGTAIFFVALGVLKGRLPVKTANSRAAGWVWAGAGWALFVTVLALMLIGYRTGVWAVMGAISPIVLATYGSSWTVAGLITGRGWLRGVGAASYAMALVCAWFTAQAQILFLVYAAALFALVALPGFVLMRQEQKG